MKEFPAWVKEMPWRRKWQPAAVFWICEPWTSWCSSWFWKTQRNQRSNCQHPLDHGKSKRVLEKHLFLLYWLCQSLCVDHNKLWKILQEMGIPDHLICLLRNLCAGQEATVRTGHRTTDWFQIGKGVHQGCILSSCLFNFYAEYIMRKAGLILLILVFPITNFFHSLLWSTQSKALA